MVKRARAAYQDGLPNAEDALATLVAASAQTRLLLGDHSCAYGGPSGYLARPQRSSGGGAAFEICRSVCSPRTRVAWPASVPEATQASSAFRVSRQLAFPKGAPEARKDFSERAFTSPSHTPRSSSSAPWHARRCRDTQSAPVSVSANLTKAISGTISLFNFAPLLTADQKSVRFPLIDVTRLPTGRRPWPLERPRLRLDLLHQGRHGKGPPEGMEAQLFEPFATTKPHGTGLGLVSVRECARAHGGRVEYARSPLGAAFTLVLPLPATS